MRRAAWFVLVLLLVSGCSSGGGSTAQAPASATNAPSPQVSASSSASTTVEIPPVPSSSVTVGPVSVPWKRTEEIQHYRSAMRPVKSELQKLASMSTSTGLSGTRSAIRALAAASNDAAETIRTGAWSSALRDPANALIAALLAQHDFLEKLAAKPDMTAIQAEADRTGKTLLSTQAAVSAVEKALGIGSKAIDLAPASPGSS